MLEDIDNNNYSNDDQPQQHIEQTPEYTHERYERIKSRSEYCEEDLVVIRAEVKIPSSTYNMLDQFILRYFDPTQDNISVEELVNHVFGEWAQKVTTDYKEFGKLMLNPIRQGCGLQSIDFKED